MTEQLEALMTLRKLGTMNAAANRLRLTASAISKRIDSLESQVGYKLIEPKGRRVELTPAGLRLAERLEPILAQLKSVLNDEKTNEGGEVSIGVTESVLASWGAPLLSRCAEKLANIRIRIHTHRSPLVLEKVRAGELSLGLCAGLSDHTDDLRVDLVAREELAIVPKGLKGLKLSKAEPIDVMTIESHAMTMDSVRRQLRNLKSKKGIEIRLTQELESFTCIAQLARSGYANGLVPFGIAKASGISLDKIVRIPTPGLYRPVSLVARASSLSRGSVQALREIILGQAQVLSITEK